MTGPPRVLNQTSQAVTGTGPKTPAFADAQTDTLTFVNRKARITVPIASCRLERTIEGASNITVTVHDPEFSFLNSEAIKGPKHGELESFVVVEGQAFAIAGIHLLAGHMIEVVLEDEAVFRLRQNKTALTMSRGKVTRAQFIKHIFAESGVPLVSKELAKRQPQKSPQEEETRDAKDKKHKPGISDHAKLTVKGQPADAEQRKNIETALEVAVSHGAGELAAVALLEAIIEESECRNTVNGNGTSTGILEVLSSTAAGLHVDPRDVAAVCALFLTTGYFGQGGAIALAKAHPDWDAGRIAQAVQGSDYPERYGVWKAEATKMVDEFTGSDASVLKEGTTFVKEYQYERKQGEDSWKCARRLAEEVGWYLFIVDGVAHFESGKSLKAGRALMLVKPGADGLIGHPTYGYMTSHSYDDTITVKCHASKWGSPPGSIAEVEGYGPVEGRWITTAIVREAMKSSVTIITLGHAKEAGKEPAHEIGTRPAGEVVPTGMPSGIPKAAGGQYRDPPTQGPSGTGKWRSWTVALWIIPMLDYAVAHGWKGELTSGFRPGFDPNTTGGVSEHSGVQYPHGAVDFGGPTEYENREAFFAACKGYTGLSLIPAQFINYEGHPSDGGHASGTGH